MIETVKTPWHLWLVGVLSLLWNGFGAFDFIQTTTRGEAYMREMGFGPEMIAYYNAMPSWMYGPWILGVWGAVIGSILLLVRSRWAVTAFAASLLGAAVSLIYSKLIDPPPVSPEMAAMAVMPWVILLIAAFLAWYAWFMAKRGVLR
ncbi:hypothetical protein [Brevundimonas sp.]|jgi:hypothetical protein|uniref:hypothetical protein n=1 Tax=Brevundimonas sp. TaxID=1871086 RepID=UPI0017D4424D|nr:hypothetical protein [Brevundimonas sp.]MBA4807477.1 hypothetical protein [Brevundimonas sp.]